LALVETGSLGSERLLMLRVRLVGAGQASCCFGRVMRFGTKVGEGFGNEQVRSFTD